MRMAGLLLLNECVANMISLRVLGTGFGYAYERAVTLRFVGKLQRQYVIEPIRNIFAQCVSSVKIPTRLVPVRIDKLPR